MSQTFKGLGTFKKKMIYGVSVAKPPVRTELESRPFGKEAVRSHQRLLSSPAVRLRPVLSIVYGLSHYSI